MIDWLLLYTLLDYLDNLQHCGLSNTGMRANGNIVDSLILGRARTGVAVQLYRIHVEPRCTISHQHISFN